MNIHAPAKSYGRSKDTAFSVWQEPDGTTYLAIMNMSGLAEPNSSVALAARIDPIHYDLFVEIIKTMEPL